MNTKRIGVLFAVILAGFSAVFLLPKSAAQPVGVKLALPSTIGEWWGTDEAISKKERETLGAETEFARKTYKNYFLTELPEYSLLTSMVLSGHDMSNSIHRPERCLNAQGWSVLGSQESSISVKGKGSFPVTRLYNRKILTDENGKPVIRGGREVVQNAYTFYWFVGEHAITGSHWGRFFRDNRDRLLRGVNQRWAFITVTGLISTSTDAEPDPKLRDKVDKTLRAFIAELAPHIHGDGLSYD